MLPKVGGSILAAMAVGLAIVTVAVSWQWWITALVALIGAVCFALTLVPERKKVAEPEPPKVPATTFKGDLDGSKFDTVWSSAHTFADGNARNAEFKNITHAPDNNGD